jgi:hypothetical protein
MTVIPEKSGLQFCAAVVSRVRALATLPVPGSPTDQNILLYTGGTTPALYIASAVDTWIPVAAAQALSLPTVDLTTSGLTFAAFLAGEAITAGQLVYLKSDGKWWKADADAVATAGGMLALSLETKGAGAAMNVAFPGGLVKNAAWAWTAGDVLIASGTAGALDTLANAPVGTDSLTRIMGYAFSATVVYFNPDNSYLTHT